jgi:hypothetical protein
MEIPRSAARELTSVARSADCAGFGRYRGHVRALGQLLGETGLFLPLFCAPDGARSPRGNSRHEPLEVIPYNIHYT